MFLKYKELTDKERFYVMRVIFGGHVNSHDYHYVGLDFNILAHYLIQTGFKKVDRVHELGIFKDTSVETFKDVPVSLNVIALKQSADVPNQDV